MQIELMWCQAVLKRWSEGPPDRPICEINVWQFPKDTRIRPYTPQEIQDMRDFLKKHGMTYDFPSSSSSSALD
jgi:hypothetical protein